MARRIHLDSVQSPQEILWFTLIYDGPSRYFVEQYRDSKNAFLRSRLLEIQPKDFDEIMVNGVPLKKLVNSKLEEIEKPR